MNVEFIASQMIFNKVLYKILVRKVRVINSEIKWQMGFKDAKQKRTFPGQAESTKKLFYNDPSEIPVVYHIH